MGRVAMLIDTSKCTACRGCQVACKQWNDLEGWEYSKTLNWGSYENPPDLSPQTWTRIRFHEYEGDGRLQWLFTKQGCMHCGDAACVKVCPTGALKKHAGLGIVTVEWELCNGCGYCQQFCPFDVPRLESDTLTGKGTAFKCHLCQDRVTNGLLPACIKTCPSGALSFGEWADMRAKGLDRVQDVKAMGFTEARLYGDTLVGGLSRLYVLTAPPVAYGLPDRPTYPVLANIWQDIVQPLGEIAIGATALGLLLNFLVVRRRIKVEEED